MSNISIHYLDKTTNITGHDDFVPLNNEILTFATGESSKVHTITILQDSLLEVNPNEYFTSSIAVGLGTAPGELGIDIGSGPGEIDILNGRATITIDDNDEPESGR